MSSPGRGRTPRGVFGGRRSCLQLQSKERSSHRCSLSRAGAITVRSAEGLDFETSPRLRLVLQAESGGAFAFSVLTLTLQDANDNAPRFLRPHYVAFLPESRPLEGPLLQVWSVVGG